MFGSLDDYKWWQIVLAVVGSLSVLVLFAVAFSGLPEDQQTRINEIMMTRAVGGVPVVIVK